MPNSNARVEEALISVSVFGYGEYKKYLDAYILALPGQGRGFRGKLAEALGCQAAYISQVLNGDAQLSLEQADLAARFLKLKRNETRYFLLLVELARAGSESLRKFLATEASMMRDEYRSTVKGRMDLRDELTLEQQTTYYSRWFYTAIHILLTVPGFRTVDQISLGLRVDSALVEAALTFLVSCGLASEVSSGVFESRRSVMHVRRDSPAFVKHHQNWRMQSIRLLEENGPRVGDLSFTAVITVSEKDLAEIHQRLLRAIENISDVVRPSAEEKLVCLNIDLLKMV